MVLNKVNFQAIDLKSIHNGMQEEMLSIVLHKALRKTSFTNDIKDFLESFFEVPEDPSQEYFDFFNALSGILYLDESKNRYEFFNENQKYGLLSESIDYFHEVQTKCS